MVKRTKGHGGIVTRDRAARERGDRALAEHDDPNQVDCGPTCPRCREAWEAEREEAERVTKRRGRPPLDLPRVCSACGADVVRPGVLRPVPLCARCYFRSRRAAKGKAPRVRVVRVRMHAADFERLASLGGPTEIATGLAALVANGVAVVDGNDLAPAGAGVRGSPAKEGACRD